MAASGTAIFFERIADDNALDVLILDDISQTLAQAGEVMGLRAPQLRTRGHHQSFIAPC